MKLVVDTAPHMFDSQVSLKKIWDNVGFQIKTHNIKINWRYKQTINKLTSRN